MKFINYMREVAILKALRGICKIYIMNLVGKLRIDKNARLFIGIYSVN